MTCIFVRPTFWLGNVLWKVGDIGIINGLIDGTAAGVYRVTAASCVCRRGTSTTMHSPCSSGWRSLITYFTFMSGGR